MSRRGFPVVLSAPSGGGKDTIAEALVKRIEFIRKSRSTTTRPPRPGETPGLEYDFVDEKEFARMKAAGEFVESARVHGHEYGTSKAFVEEVCGKGLCPLLVIDVKGGLAIKAFDPKSVLVFLMPPSMDELERRLRDRSTESPEALETRLANARQEIAVAPEYDYIVVNDRLDSAIEQVCHLLTHGQKLSEL